MTAYALPMDATSGSPSYNAAQTRTAFAALMGWAPSGRPVGAASGVRPGTPTNTVTVTTSGGASTWSVAAHCGVLDVQSSPLAGPYLYASNGADTGNVTAADATNPRVDIIYVQVSDNVQDSTGFEQCAISYLAGTPATSPAAPATPARSIVLAQINVPKSGGGNPTVSWVAPVFRQTPAMQRTANADQSIPDSSWTALTNWTTVKQTGGVVGAGGGAVSVPVDGWYSVAAALEFSTNPTGRRGVRICAPGVIVRNFVAGGITGGPTLTTPVYLTSGTQVHIEAYQESGAALAVLGNSNNGTAFALTYVGP